MRRYPQPKKKSIVLYLILLGISIGSMVGIRTCRNSDIYGPRRQGGSQGDTIDIALLYAPMSYYMYDDTLGGYCHDALLEASRTGNIPIRLWPVVNLEEALQQLKNGNFDMVAPLPVDNALRKEYEYTRPIYLDRQVLVQRKGPDGEISVKSSLDLASDTLHIAQGSPVSYRLHNLIGEIGDTIYTVSHADLSDEYLMMKVAEGKIRYAVVSDHIARRMQEQYPQVDISTPISFTQFQSGIMRKGEAKTHKSIDHLLRHLEELPSAATLRARYGL